MHIEELSGRLMRLEPGLTAEELDGAPSGVVKKIVFPNGTLTIVGNVATYTPAGGGGGSAEPANHSLLGGI